MSAGTSREAAGKTKAGEKGTKTGAARKRAAAPKEARTTPAATPEPERTANAAVSEPARAEPRPLLPTGPAVYLSAQELIEWVRQQAGIRRVLAPAREGHATLFRAVDAARLRELCLDRARISPKAAALPSGETLLFFSAAKDAADPGKLHVRLEDQAGKNVADTLIFGCRSCDARGFLALDKAYLAGAYQDPYYAARRAATLIVARTCSSPCSTCFCHWVGGGPDSPEGTDALFTLIEGGCVLTPYTDKGAQLLKDLPAANGQAVSEAEAGRAAARKILAYAPARLARMGEVAEKIAGRFAQTEFWQEHTAGCLACGACTYMCPTCQCFTITDEGDLSRGKRLRSWDSCMNAHFTREASGHNPRAAKAVRMRQRVSHKYSYSPQNAAIYSCTGCGRCVRYCPAALDIREIVLAATAD